MTKRPAAVIKGCRCRRSGWPPLSMNGCKVPVGLMQTPIGMMVWAALAGSGPRSSRLSQRPPAKRVAWISGQWPEKQKHVSELIVAVVIPLLAGCKAPGLSTPNQSCTLHCDAELLRPALQVMNRLAVNRDRFRVLELFDIFFRELRPVHLDRQPVELGGQRERGLVVRVVHTG